jgi:alkaline phosphatase
MVDAFDSESLLELPEPSCCSQQKKRILIFGGTLIIISMVIFFVIFFSEEKHPKNVILMVADGFGPVAVTLARECLQVSTKRRLTLDSILTGTASTYSANSLVTDSAAAATALACGIKTYNYNVGVGVDGKPCGTLLEAAKVKGMQTAVVVTSEITHATPASFTAHVLSRESVDTIGDQQMDQNITLILGGGLAIFNSTSRNSMLAKARSKHYTLVLSKEELTRGNNLSLPLIGLFASSHLAYEIDRNRTSQPSLAEMTNAALQLLSRGFLLCFRGVP